MLSLYIHIPFCRKKCLYCNFCSVTYDKPLAWDYIGVLIKQIEDLKGRFSSIYIGGGTPTVLENRFLEKLLKSLKKSLNPETEFTIEANPESLSGEILGLFLNFGVNRLSIGTQSFNDAKLKKLGRVHNARAGLDAVYTAKKKGFKNISIDLIFGAWNEDMESWEEDLKKAVHLPVEHISAYALTYEEGTPLFGAQEKGEIRPQDNEEVGRMYEWTMGYLEKNGFRQYEVSNFAREGYPCLHNLNYWQNNSYIGLGASAVSYIEGTRKENISDIKEYISRVKKTKDYIIFQEKLSVKEKAQETAALKIRTKSGIDFEWFKGKTGFDFLELEAAALVKLTEAGFIGYNADKSAISLTQKGFLFSDIVSSEFL